MSDTTPPRDEPTTAAEPTTAEPTTGSAARPRPANPGAAAARRARQMGGPASRRPSPRPRPEPAADVETAVTGATVQLDKPAASPRSPVGKAAARPRPRPRPTVEDPEPDTLAETAVAAPPRRGLLAGTAVLTVLLLAAGVVFLVLALTAKPAVSPQETERALAAAKTDVALLTSYGWQTIDSDAAKASAVITGTFKQQYLDAVDKTIKPQLPTSQTVTTGQVDTAGLVSADARGRQVVVLVYGQQSVTNKVQTTPRIDAFQVRVTMQRVGDQWLVSSLEQLGNNA